MDTFVNAVRPPPQSPNAMFTIDTRALHAALSKKSIKIGQDNQPVAIPISSATNHVISQNSSAVSTANSTSSIPSSGSAVLVVGVEVPMSPMAQPSSNTETNSAKGKRKSKQVVKAINIKKVKDDTSNDKKDSPRTKHEEGNTSAKKRQSKGLKSSHDVKPKILASGSNAHSKVPTTPSKDSMPTVPSSPTVLTLKKEALLSASLESSFKSPRFTPPTKLNSSSRRLPQNSVPVTLFSPRPDLASNFLENSSNIGLNIGNVMVWSDPDPTHEGGTPLHANVGGNGCVEIPLNLLIKVFSEDKTTLLKAPGYSLHVVIDCPSSTPVQPIIEIIKDGTFKIGFVPPVPGDYFISAFLSNSKQNPKSENENSKKDRKTGNPLIPVVQDLHFTITQEGAPAFVVCRSSMWGGSLQQGGIVAEVVESTSKQQYLEMKIKLIEQAQQRVKIMLEQAQQMAVAQ